MCIFCEIMSSRSELRGSDKRRVELPWAGRTPIDQYRLSSEWRARNAENLGLFGMECKKLSLRSVKGAAKHRPVKAQSTETKPVGVENG